MPKFEEDNTNTSTSENYSPSADASEKPRTRRRSGGFKSDFVPVVNNKLGVVSAKEALKEEKLSGKISKQAEPKSEISEQTVRTKSPKLAMRESRKSDPKPSPKTLEAIAVVEARIYERRANREKIVRAKSKHHHRAKSDRKRKLRKNSKGGMLKKIGKFIASLLGFKPKCTKRGKYIHRYKGRKIRPNRKWNKQKDVERKREAKSRERGGKSSHRSEHNTTS